MKIMVFVGDYGEVLIPEKVWRAYGLTSCPINRRSSKQRRLLVQLETAIATLQRHEWVMGRFLERVE